MSYKVRVFEHKDTDKVLALITDIIVNEFHFRLELQENVGGLDSDLLHIEDHYNRSCGCFWVAEEDNNNHHNNNIVNHAMSNSIIGTIGVRRLKLQQEQTSKTCELKRMYVLKPYRNRGIAQKMLDEAIEFAKSAGYSRIVLDSSKWLTAARSLYLKNEFKDIERYNNNYRADVFMEKVL